MPTVRVAATGAAVPGARAPTRRGPRVRRLLRSHQPTSSSDAPVSDSTRSPRSASPPSACTRVGAAATGWLMAGTAVVAGVDAAVGPATVNGGEGKGAGGSDEKAPDSRGGADAPSGSPGRGGPPL